MKGYIVKGIGGFYYVKTEEGVIECKPRGIFRKQKITPVAGDEVTLETSFEDDLGADSVDLVELVMAMEEEFELGQTAEDEVKAIKTVGDAVNYVAGKLNG